MNSSWTSLLTGKYSFFVRVGPFRPFCDEKPAEVGGVHEFPGWGPERVGGGVPFRLGPTPPRFAIVPFGDPLPRDDFFLS